MASLFNIFLITFLYAEVFTWTIDLPEVRKFIFEKNQRYQHNEKVNHEENLISDVYYYDNKDENSLHHKESEKETPHYAEQYGYQPYMESKVTNIMNRGSTYLEELRTSIERYTNLLQNCTASNFSLATNSTWQPRLELPGSLNVSRSISCAEVTRTSEHVRRLADLAMQTARELQDIGFAKKYQKVDYQRENELILKLAWFLDRLAHYTGYDPDLKGLSADRKADKDNLSSNADNRNPVVPYPIPITPVNSSQEVRDLMMNCMKRNTSEPAVDRCRYPFPLPPLSDGILNPSSTTPTPDTAESVLPVPSTPDPTEPISDETQELLITTDNRHFAPRLTAVKAKSVRKRSIDDPTDFFKFYMKSKIWLSSNAENNDIKSKFDPENDFSLKKIIKRSLVGKKYVHLLPQNPIQNLGDYVKSKSTTRFHKNNDEAIEIRNYLQNMQHKKSLSKVMNKKYNITKELNRVDKKIQKRSVTYIKPVHPLIGSLIQFKPIKIVNKERVNDIKKLLERFSETRFVQKLLKHRPKRSTALTYREMKKPRISENPFSDISYYVKNKPSTNENPSLTQAAQARLALEQHFATGNILVVRQFGSNYNPLVPHAFYFGFMKTLSDS